MAQIVKWHAKSRPTGSVGGNYLWAGDNGYGDSDGPTFVHTAGNLQSRMWVNYHPHPDGDSRRRSADWSHYFGPEVVPQPWRAAMGWAFPGGPVPQWSFRLGYRFGWRDIFLTPGGYGGTRAYIMGTAGAWDDGVPSWELVNTHDSGTALRSGWLGLQYTWIYGGKHYIAQPGQPNSPYAPSTPEFLADVPSEHSGGHFQTHGHGYSQGRPMARTADYWIEGRCQADGTLDIRWFSYVSERLHGTLTTTIQNPSMGGFHVGGQTRNNTGHNMAENGLLWDVEVWDDAPSDANWPRGKYSGAPISWQRITQSSPPAVENLQYVGTVRGPEGLVSGQPGVIVNTTPPLVGWTGEVKRNPRRYDYIPSVGLDQSGVANFGGRLYRPELSDFPGPYPLIVWGHPGFYQRRTDYIEPDLLEELIGHGYAVLDFDYPFVSPPDLVAQTYMVHPKQIRYHKRVLHYFIDNALTGAATTWEIDPTKVFATGYSAGGNLMAQAAVTANLPVLNDGTDGRLQAISAGVGPYNGIADPVPRGIFTWAAPVNWQRHIAEDFTNFIARNTAQAYMGLPFGAGTTSSYATSVHHNVHGGITIPWKYIVGSDDPLIGDGNITDLENAYTAAGIPNLYEGHLIGASHDNIMRVQDPLDATTGIIPWLQSVLGGTETPA